MNKKNIVRFLFLLGICVIVSICVPNYNVKATSLEENISVLDEIINTEEKIMMYDAVTKETTEVDMEELKKVIKAQNNTNSIKSYIPSDIKTYSEVGLPKLAPAEVRASATSVNRITNTSTAPYITTCRIAAKNSSGSNVYGTASMVGPNVALTCAHCVFDPYNENATYQDWTIYPGFNGTYYYGAACGWSRVYYSNNWYNNHDGNYDWAICVLEAYPGVGNFGVQSYGTRAEMYNMNVRVLGYPGDTSYGFTRDAIYQYETGEKITTTVTDYQFLYTGWTFGGFSGGPILRSDNYIVGIHKGISTSNTPLGVRITQEMINLIVSASN